MRLTNGQAQYEVGRLVAQAAAYRQYLCHDEAAGSQFLLQIANGVAQNGQLERAAHVLRLLRQASDRVDEKAAQSSEPAFHYERLFPELVDSFVAAEDQGKRQVNILGFTGVGIEDMMPLSNLTDKDRVRIDLKTSAWIMGRLLKLLAFVHGESIAVQSIPGSSILISPQDHLTVVYDWSSSFTHSQEVPKEDRANDISQAATSVFIAIGGDAGTGEYPYAVSDEDTRYVRFLVDLVSKHYGDAVKAHRRFYELVDELYGKQFHTFTTLPLQAAN